MKVNYVGLEKVDVACRHILKSVDGVLSRDNSCMHSNCVNENKCNVYIKEYNKARLVWFGTQPVAKIEITTSVTAGLKEKTSLDRLKEFQPIMFAIKKREELKKRTDVTRLLIHYIVREHLCTEDAELIYSQVKRFSIVKPHDIEVRYITDNRGTEERVKEKIERMGFRNISKIKVTTRSPELDAQREQVKKFSEKKVNPLIEKIKTLGDSIEVITLEE